MSVRLNFGNFHSVASSGNERDIIAIQDDDLSLFSSKKFGSPPPETNRRTWTALIDAAEKQYGASRVERVWKFYKIDPQKMIRQNKPLTVSHVHMLEVGTMKVRMNDLRKKIGGTSVAYSRPAEIADAVRSMTRYSASPLRLTARNIHGAPTRTTSFFSYDPYLMDQELQALFKDVGNLSRNAYIERLNKAIISRELPEGTLIPAPSADKSGYPEYYVVYKCISKGDGLVAYALKPVSKHTSLKPMVVFRPSPYHPSGLDFLETWLNNMQKNMGWLGYQTARGALGQLMYDPEFCSLNQPISVCGYSLGGVHAQLLIADYYERVGEAIFFNSPSIDADTAEMFAVKINALPHLNFPMRVRIYRTKGDVSHYANEKHLFWGVHHNNVDIKLTEIMPDDNLTAKQSHGWRHFDSPIKAYKKKVIEQGPELDKQLNNRQRGEDVMWYENMRLLFGSYIIYPILFVWSRILQGLERYMGLSILRRTPRQVITR